MGYEIPNDNLREQDAEAAEIATEAAIAERWRSYLYSKIDAAVGAGAMIGVEASEWYGGVDACTRVEYLVELDGFFDEYCAAGMAAKSDAETTVAHEPLLTDAEQNAVMNEVAEAPYHERLAITTREIYRIVMLRVEQKKLDAVIAQLDAKSKRSIEDAFYNATSDKKPEVVKNAADESEKILADERLAKQRVEEEALVSDIERAINAGDIDRAELYLDRLGNLEGFGVAFMKWSRRVDELRVARVRSELLDKQAA